MIKAEIIADSLNEHGQRLTTFVLCFPRIVLAEFNTHRMLSRNSASSRAIPFEKMLKRLEEDPFLPIRWMKEHKGMQGTEYFDNLDGMEATEDELNLIWIEARDAMMYYSQKLSSRGVTKQICNRLLEPFIWHTAIVTASDWENFFALRAHEAAEIHIQDLAHKMLEAYNTSAPKQLRAGDWHIPFGDKMEASRIVAMTHQNTFETRWSDRIEQAKIQIATARCARVSYLNFEGKDDYGADVKLHDMLLKSGHMSPFEHCARAMSKVEYEELHKHEYGDLRAQRGWSGNFQGFIQYRKMIKDENKKDTRVVPREK